MQQSTRNLNTAFKNFYRGVKNHEKVGFPKFKSKHRVKWSYREPQTGNFIKIKNSKINLLKLGFMNG